MKTSASKLLLRHHWKQKHKFCLPQLVYSAVNIVLPCSFYIAHVKEFVVQRNMS